MTSSSPNVFCDWLDVTCSPEQSFVAAVGMFLDRHGFPIAYADDEAVLISVGAGKIKLDTRSRFHRASASGSVLAHFRKMGIFEDYLSLLATLPHKITRLDAALDLPIDGPDFLRSLEGRYPDDIFHFGRKGLKVTRLYSARASDHRQTGTWYVGHRSKARVTARVYDKQNEALEQRGEELPPTTRIELTFSKDYGSTLRDAAMPASIFFNSASPELIPEPLGISPWVAHGEGWAPQPIDVSLPYELFKRRVELSPEIAHLAALGAGFGEQGIALILRTIETQLRTALPNPLEADG